jgi:hypothetical protein
VADNSSQTGADTIRTKDRSGVKTTIVGIDITPGGGSETLLSSTAPLPVNLSSSAGSGSQVAASLTAVGASTLAGTGNTTGSVVIDVSQAGNASFHLLAAAFVGTVVFEQSFDPAGANGTWALVPCIPEDGTTAPVSTLAISTAVAYIKQFTTGMFGPKLFRVRCSVFTSGTLAVLGSAGPGWYEGQPALAPGINVIGAASLVGGATAALSQSSIGTSASTPLAADATRRGVMVWNTSTSATVFLGFGSTPTTSTYAAALAPGTGYRVDPEFAQLSIQAIASAAATATNFQSVTL